MVAFLTKIPFNAELLPLVANFNCGDAPWETELNDWISGGFDRDSAVSAIRNYGAEVWLYKESSGSEVVGFGSLMEGRWNWPSESQGLVPITIVPGLAIQRKFRGQPRSLPFEERFFSQIVAHLLFEANKYIDERPLIGIFVHPRNTRAWHIYLEMGFEPYSVTWADEETGVVYKSMIMSLQS